VDNIIAGVIKEEIHQRRKDRVCDECSVYIIIVTASNKCAEKNDHCKEKI
jgi:hypothetical protein